MSSSVQKSMMSIYVNIVYLTVWSGHINIGPVLSASEFLWQNFRTDCFAKSSAELWELTTQPARHVALTTEPDKSQCLTSQAWERIQQHSYCFGKPSDRRAWNPKRCLCLGFQIGWFLWTGLCEESIRGEGPQQSFPCDLEGRQFLCHHAKEHRGQSSLEAGALARWGFPFHSWRVGSSPRSWIVGAVDPPPAQQLHFNGMPILIRELKPKATVASPITAGPKPIVQEHSGCREVAPSFGGWPLGSIQQGACCCFSCKCFIGCNGHWPHRAEVCPTGGSTCKTGNCHGQSG